MSEAEWHLVRAGRPQLIGSHRRTTGESFQFLPLFRTHREAAHYCRQSGLWCQEIRPRHNTFPPKETQVMVMGCGFFLPKPPPKESPLLGFLLA